MSNLPPCILDEELDSLGLILPADHSIWSASTQEEWFRLVNMSDPQSIIGRPIRVTLDAYLSGEKVALPPFDPVSSFIIIQGILRVISIFFISGRHDEQRYRVKQALDTWTQQRLQLFQNLNPAEYNAFNWIGLFVYMLAVVIHDDTTRLASKAEQNVELYTGWLAEIPDTISKDRRTRMKASCTPFRQPFN